MTFRSARKYETHTVRPEPDGFHVISGTSGKEYIVTPLSNGAACNCEFGKRSSGIAVRCSHVRAVEAFAAGAACEFRPAQVALPADPFQGFREDDTPALPARNVQATPAEPAQDFDDSDPAGLEPELTATMRRECCVCRADMGTKPCIPSMAGSVSHGYCPTCDAQLRRDLGLEQEPKTWPPTTTHCWRCNRLGIETRIPFEEMFCEPCRQIVNYGEPQEESR